MDQWQNKEYDLDIAADIQKKRMEWIGDPVRMNYGRVVKKIFDSKPKGRSRRRRRRPPPPRLRWLVDVEKDLWETKVKRW